MCEGACVHTHQDTIISGNTEFNVLLSLHAHQASSHINTDHIILTEQNYMFLI